MRTTTKWRAFHAPLSSPGGAASPPGRSPALAKAPSQTPFRTPSPATPSGSPSPRFHGQPARSWWSRRPGAVASSEIPIGTPAAQPLASQRPPPATSRRRRPGADPSRIAGAAPRLPAARSATQSHSNSCQRSGHYSPDRILPSVTFSDPNCASSPPPASLSHCKSVVSQVSRAGIARQFLSLFTPEMTSKLTALSQFSIKNPPCSLLQNVIFAQMTLALCTTPPIDSTQAVDNLWITCGQVV